MSKVVTIDGVSVRISPEHGGLIIWGTDGMLGKRVQLMGRGDAYGQNKHGRFFEHDEGAVCVFSMLTPGEYRYSTSVSGYTLEAVSIEAEWVTQESWT